MVIASLIIACLALLLGALDLILLIWFTEPLAREHDRYFEE